MQRTTFSEIPYRIYLIIKYLWRKAIAPWHACFHAYAIPYDDNSEHFSRDFFLILYIKTFLMSLRHRKEFDNTKFYCNFLGYARSGHSLAGALIDAHPDAIISHEVDVIGMLRFGIFGKNQIFSLILESSKNFADAGRNWGDYSYKTDNQWQGRYKTLKVIGDKKGGAGTTWLKKNPKLLERLNKTVVIPVKHIHHIRNPFDNISTYCIKKGLNEAVEEFIEFYFSRCSIVQDVKKHIDPENIIEQRHEHLIAQPKDYMKQLCEFLELECSDDYLESCSKIVFETPRKTRHKITWNDPMIKLVDEHIAKFDFLKGYTYVN